MANAIRVGNNGNDSIEASSAEDDSGPEVVEGGKIDIIEILINH